MSTTLKKTKLNDSTEETLKVDFKRRKVHVDAAAFVIREEKHIVAFIPSLDITAYGKTMDALKEMLDEIFSDFFDSLFDNGQSFFKEQVERLGWEQKPLFKKKFINKVHIDAKGVLRNLELPEDTPIEEMLVMS